jgi:hypothetical protein
MPLQVSHQISYCLTIKIKNLAMLRKMHGTNFFHIQFLGRTSIKCQNAPVLPPAQVFILMVKL